MTPGGRYGIVPLYIKAAVWWKRKDPSMNRSLFRLGAVLGCGALLVPAQGFAHVSGASHSHPGVLQSFADGLVHPLTGLDHLLAMVALGLWIAKSTLRDRGSVAGIFVGAMLLGALIGVSGPAVPEVEFLIGASVVVLGALVAAGRGAHFITALSLSGVFALFHGFTHGAEMGALDAAPYFSGFLLSSGLLVLGASYAAGALKGSQTMVLRPAGALICAAGAAMLLGLV